MTDIQNKKDQPWSEVSRQLVKANVKAAEAHRAWLRSTVDLNTLGQNEQVVKEVNDTRAAAYAEYKRCHDEAFRLSVISNSLYRDMAGSDDHLFIK